jgi:hypothetical protein
MLTRIIKRVPDCNPWVVDPGRLIEKFLDHLDKLNALVLPADAGTPSLRYAEVEARRRDLAG